MSRFSSGTCIVLLSLLTATEARAQTSTQRVLTGVRRPVFATAPPGDRDRLFIAEQHTGIIQILDLNSGNLQNPPFLDIDSLATGNEQGLLGLAFDPDYATNGFFYVNLTTSAGGGDTVIRRYQATGDPATSTSAAANSATTILTFNQPQSNHNGGWIGFGPDDGHLYIATGDGGSGNDSGNGHTTGIGNAQDITNNLLGKILRIDPSRDQLPTIPYTVPADNPFVGTTGDDEIWSFGLRNPYRTSFDRATGDLWIGDVGQGSREEIDYQPASSLGGENYGWRLREGTITTPSPGIGGERPLGNVEPIYDYRHANSPQGPDFQGNVVIGGYVYRGPVAAFQGHYFFSDAGSGNIWKLDPDAVDVPASVTRVNGLLSPDAGSLGGLSSFSEDDAGDLYLMELSGEIFRVTTSAEQIVWRGSDAASGAVGDGSNWEDAQNWSRAGVPDEPFVAGDNVLFPVDATPGDVHLGADRRVSAISLAAPYTLHDNTLTVQSGNITVTAGVTATIESDLAAETAAHSIRKLGPGTLLVEGQAGQTVVKAGTLGGHGTLDHLRVEAGATVAPGSSAGRLTVEDSFTLEADATLAIEIGGTDPDAYDRLVVQGAAEVLDGTLQVSLIDVGNGLFAPEAGDGFPIFSASGGFAAFGEISLPDLSPGLVWQLNPGGITLFLNVQSTIPGDANGDGSVDFADLSAMVLALTDPIAYARSFSGEFRVARCDASGDGNCNFQDLSPLAVLLQGTGTAGQNIPEPTTLLLVWAGILGGMSIRVGRRPLPAGRG